MSVPKSIVASAGAALVFVSTGVRAQETANPEWFAYAPNMMRWGGGWYGMIFGPLFMILVLAVAIAFAVLLVRWLGGPWQGPASHVPGSSTRSPVDILKERFARGEIDKEEFEERWRLLGD